MSQHRSIGLAEFCEQVKRELLQHNPERQSFSPLFSVEQVELELQVTVSKEGKGGIQIHVLEIGGGAKRDDVQKVKVTLKPLLTTEERLEYYKSKDREGWEAAMENSLNLLKGKRKPSLDKEFGG